MSQAVLNPNLTRKIPMGSVPNCRKEIANRYPIRWFKCKLKPPKKAKRLKCEKGCDKDFVDMKSLKGHYRKIHPPGGLKDIPCPFTGCPKVFQNKTNLAQHKRCCTKNSDRLEFVCPMCGKGGFWNLNKFQEHKRTITSGDRLPPLGSVKIP